MLQVSYEIHGDSFLARGGDYEAIQVSFYLSI